MSNFQFVQWSGNLPIDSDRLKAMSENDNYINDILYNSPKGVLNYIINESATSLYAAGTSYFARFENTILLDRPSAIKFTLIPGYSSSTQTGPRSLTVQLEIDGQIEAFYIKHTENFAPSTGDLYDDSYTPPLITIARLNQGSHTCKIKFTSSKTIYPFLGAKFIVQDIGRTESVLGL